MLEAKGGRIDVERFMEGNMRLAAACLHAKMLKGHEVRTTITIFERKEGEGEGGVLPSFQASGVACSTGFLAHVVFFMSPPCIVDPPLSLSTGARGCPRRPSALARLPPSNLHFPQSGGGGACARVDRGDLWQPCVHRLHVFTHGGGRDTGREGGEVAWRTHSGRTGCVPSILVKLMLVSVSCGFVRPVARTLCPPPTHAVCFLCMQVAVCL